MPNLSVVSKIMKYFQSQTKLGHFHISSCLAALWDLERKKKHKSQFKAWVVALIVFQIQPELERTGDPLGETCSQETSVKFWACSSWVSALFIELPERYQTYSGPLSNIQFHLGNNFLISPAILWDLKRTRTYSAGFFTAYPYAWRTLRWKCHHADYDSLVSYITQLC